jgi:homoserine kinase
MRDRSVLIRVPATVGNFGGAGNCAALALDATLNVRASTRQDGGVGIRYFGEHGQRVPRDASNLTVRAIQVALDHEGREFCGVDLEMYGSVPVGVGLGSSAAAVWAGLLAADRLYQLGLEEKVLFSLADSLERRSENLRAAWFGGFVARFEDGPAVTHQPAVAPDDWVLTVVTPDLGSIQTVEAAGPNLPGGDRSAYFRRARSLSSFLAHPASHANPDLGGPVPGVAEKTVPGLDEALQVRTLGMLAVFVCGSGPSIGVLAHGESSESATSAVAERLALHGVTSTSAEFSPTNTGARDWNATGTEVSQPAPVGLDLDMRPRPPLPV